MLNKVNAPINGINTASQAGQTGNYISEACAPQSCVVANEILDRLSLLEIKARDLVERVDNKLFCVMRSKYENRCIPASGEAEREYPPFFSQLRENFNSIQASLSSIEDAISRTEL